MALPTSGTVGQTQIDVTTLIEHVVRRCGLLVPTLTAEQNLTVKENLFFTLASLSNKGVNLWTIQKYVLPLAAGQQIVPMPSGTVDILNMYYRYMSYPTEAPISGTTWIGVDMVTAQAITTLGLTITSGGTYTFALEYSADLITWKVSQTYQSAAYAAGQVVWLDPNIVPTVRYWRVRETVLPVWSDATGVIAGVNGTSVKIAQLNRDDYQSMPTGITLTNTNARPLQAWYDKQINPQLWLWPAASSNEVAQLVVWTNGQIQDIGAYTNAVQIPQRWYEAIIMRTAATSSMELPKIDPNRITLLMQMADTFEQDAAQGEQDGSAFRIQPNIRRYTRG